MTIIFWILLLFTILFRSTKANIYYVQMINSLQILMHIPLFKTPLPGNIIMFLHYTIPVFMFDIIKEEWFINPTNHFIFDDENNSLRTDDPRFPRQMADIGYETHNFLKNLGSVYIFFLLYTFKLFILGILKIWTRYF